MKGPVERFGVPDDRRHVGDSGRGGIPGKGAMQDTKPDTEQRDYSGPG